MAGGASTYTANEILDLFLRGVAPTFPGTWWMRLLITSSSKTVAGTETNYGSYTRLAMVRGTSLFSAPANGQSTNSNILQFASPSTLGNGSLTAWDFVNTAAGAFTETYLYGLIIPSRTIVVGKPLKFPIGSLLITCA